VLILTTGTTGRPKGARHDWRRLVAAVRAGTPEPDARWLLAYNVNQFAGVQVLLQVLTTGTTLVVPATTSPRDVGDAMAAHGVTHASGTPTFWRFFCNQVSPDDAAGIPLRQITLGGEATDDQLLDELRKRFPDARISHVYAATEFGSAVSVRDGKYGLPRSVLDRPDDAAIRFRVVDGELHVPSRVGMLGYYGDDDADDGWRPTGDLVEEVDDRLIFVGRTSEIINVGGVKVHPLPLESAITAVPGVALARVFGRPNPMTGAIVAVEVVVADGFDPKAVDAAIREACAGFPAAARPRRVRFVDHLETRENKVVRRAGGDDTVGGPETT
jgi:acyl-coenzyme A synthetase/AMP-(fatty) acid ligase